jgi:hypothetical protein
MRFFRQNYLLALAAAFLFSGFLKANAQDEQRIPVGVQPSVIHRVGNDLHVLCSGSDVNFNGTFDSGDMTASWWILDAITLEVKSSMVFENSFLPPPPHRPAFTSNSLFVYMNGKIQQYSLFTQLISNANVVDIPTSAGMVAGLHAADFAGTEVLYITTRPSFTTPGLRYTFVLGSIDSLTNPEKLPETTGINPQQIHLKYDLVNQSGIQLILNEGASGQNSTLDITSYADGTPSKTSVNLGNNGNFFLMHGDTAFVVMTGSHSVHYVNLTSKSIVKTIETGTTGFDGPREAAINGDTLFVTTYNSDIRAFSIASGALLKTMPTSGKVDPIIMSEGKLLAGVSLKKGTYQADSALAVFGLPPIVSVGYENATLVAASLYPNPVQTNAILSIQFPESVASVSIELFNAAGISVGSFTKETVNGALQFVVEPQALQLSQGQYFARITAGEYLSVVPFVVMQ